MLGYVFDLSTLLALGRGDDNPSQLLAALDSRDVRICVPALPLSRAFAELPVQGSAELLGMVIAMRHVQVEPLADAFDALELSEVLAMVPSDPWAAHTIAAARKHDMEIVTMDRAPWRAVEQHLPWPTHLVELSDDPDI